MLHNGSPYRGATKSVVERVERAIDESITEDCIAHICDCDDWCDAIIERLMAECEDSTENGAVYEFWGVDIDGCEWRVHVRIPRKDV